MSKRRKTRMIAPRLASGERRVSFGSRLPEPIKAGLRLIAEHERKSMSWVMEEVIIRHFRMRSPKYVKGKRNESN